MLSDEKMNSKSKLYISQHTGLTETSKTNDTKHSHNLKILVNEDSMIVDLDSPSRKPPSAKPKVDYSS